MFGATPDRDNEQIAIASKVSMSILRAIQKHLEDPGKPVRGLVATLRRPIWFEVRLEHAKRAHRRGTRAVYNNGYRDGSYVRRPSITVFVPTPFAKKSVFTRQDASSANVYDIVDFDTLVHEVIHLLDYRRGGDIQQTFSKTQTLQRYFNDPLELNAFFQQAMSEFSSDHYDDAPPETFQEFHDMFMEYYHPYNHLREGNQRKVLQRLYQWWEYWRENGSLIPK